MIGLRGWELVIVLVIILLLFGVGRISKISGELGSSIRAFRDGIQGGDKKEKENEEEENENKKNE